jgi:hypothetical protein
MHVDDEPLDPRLAAAIEELRDHAPAVDFWSAIAPRLNARRPRGSILLRWPTALAAGILIALVSAAGTLIVLRRNGTVARLDPPSPTVMTAVAFTPADSALERAIHDLERAVRTTMTQLDEPARIGIVRGLTALDKAIANAAAQRLATPGDPRAEHDFTTSLQNKLDVLRSVSALTTRRS